MTPLSTQLHPLMLVAEPSQVAIAHDLVNWRELQYLSYFFSTSIVYNTYVIYPRWRGEQTVPHVT